MEQYISKSDLVEEIKNRIKKIPKDETDERFKAIYGNEAFVLTNLLSFIDTLDVKDPYEQCVQYDSIKTGIHAHAETYSFNIESLLFNQLTKEQQELWRKEIEQAVISGGEAGIELARDPRYKENFEVKEVDLDFEKELYKAFGQVKDFTLGMCIARHFYELGLKAQK